MFLYYILAAVAGAALALAIYILASRAASKGRADAIIEKANLEAESIKQQKILQAKEKFLQLKGEHENFVNKKNGELRDRENNIKSREGQLKEQANELNRRQHDLDSQKGQVNALKTKLDAKLEECERVTAQVNKELENIAGMTAEEARKMLVENMKAEARTEAQAYINDTMDEARLNAAKEAKRIVINTIQRTATETAIENAVTTFPIENDEVKGRIIGREGRNIRALEAATGVEIVVDDTPDAILLSAFDPVRREVARLSLHQLVIDGRIHPARIEETYEKAKREVNQTIKQTGERAVLDAGVTGLHPELIKLLGKLRYRTSYGQNVLDHSLEVCYIAGLIASELGADVKQARRAGLLHDIGKALDHEFEGSHVTLGADAAKKYRESEAVVHAIKAHHGDIEAKTTVAFIVQAADAISAARPGARRENIENYIKRLEKLEEIANSYGGVENSFAIQAGREIRVVVKPEKVNDDQMVIIAHDIAQRIESEMEYPGQIKIHVVRESRVMDYAK